MLESSGAPLSGVVALQAIVKHGQIKEGEKVLIYGASGSVGLFAIQLAKAYGGHVTAVCGTRHMAMAKELGGADVVMDYTKEDFSDSGVKYDLILGVNGYNPIAKYLEALAEYGRYVLIGGTGKQLMEGMVKASFMKKKAQRSS